MVTIAKGKYNCVNDILNMIHIIVLYFKLNHNERWFIRKKLSQEIPSPMLVDLTGRRESQCQEKYYLLLRKNDSSIKSKWNLAYKEEACMCLFVTDNEIVFQIFQV